MTLFMAIVVGILFSVSIYMMFGRELKEVCMGIFLLSHAANLAIMEAGRVSGRIFPPVLGEGQPVDQLVDPLPHALILTAIVIGFAVQGFLLTLLVITWRRTGTVETGELAKEAPEPGQPQNQGPSQSQPLSHPQPQTPGQGHA